MKHLRATVLKAYNGTCTNGGITKYPERIDCFIDCTEQEAINYCNEHDINPKECLIYNERTLWGKPAPIFEPLIKPEGKIGPMFGGNYVVNEYDHNFPTYFGFDRIVPIPVHDRFETPEEYEIMSR